MASPVFPVPLTLTPLDLGGWAAANVGGSLAAGIPIAIFAGLLSFFSPCVLPLLPGYLSYATGLSARQFIDGDARAHRGRVLAGTVLFVLGFAVVFVLTGALFGTVGAVLRAHARLIEIAGGVVAVVLGLIFADVIPLGRRDLRPARVSRVGVGAAPLLGAAFGIGWTPCIGPTLGAVLTLALAEGTPGKGAFLAFCYALGLGLPFVLAGLMFTRLAPLVAFVKRHQRVVMRVGGGLLALVGGLMIVGWWGLLLNRLQDALAGLGVPV